VSTPHDILDDALRIVGECEPVDVVASRSAPVAGWGTSRFKSGWGKGEPNRWCGGFAALAIRKCPRRIAANENRHSLASVQTLQFRN
jgi:hypothetical protein